MLLGCEAEAWYVLACRRGTGKPANHFFGRPGCAVLDGTNTHREALEGVLSERGKASVLISFYTGVVQFFDRTWAARACSTRKEPLSRGCGVSNEYVEDGERMTACRSLGADDGLCRFAFWAVRCRVLDKADIWMPGPLHAESLKGCEFWLRMLAGWKRMGGSRFKGRLSPGYGSTY